jgi:hypothetical protein
MLRLPDLPRSAFDLFVCARWRKALELGQVPRSASRFRSACRIAYDSLPDRIEWKALAKKDEERFEREYQEAVEKMSESTASLSEETDFPSDLSIVNYHCEVNGCSSIAPPSSSSRTLGTACSDLTLESVWKKPRPCKSLMESSANMSDLAPFVAAILRDKVVSDLMQEVTTLKLEAKRHKVQKRHERIIRKAIFMIGSSGGCGADVPKCDPGLTRLHTVTSPIYCWATKYTASGSKRKNGKKMALLQSENKCKFSDILTCQFYVKGELTGSFERDASNFVVKVFRSNSPPPASENLSEKSGKTKKKDNVPPEVMFHFSVGTHVYGFSTKCKVSTQDLLQLLGRPDVPSSSAEEVDVEQAVDLSFLTNHIRPDSRVRFQWVQQQGSTIATAGCRSD